MTLGFGASVAVAGAAFALGEGVVQGQGTSTGGLGERLASLIARHNVVGAQVAWLENGRCETASAGVANASTGQAMSTDTLMHIGSITKVLNATLVMQLVDDGLVRLDQPVHRYLPQFRLGDRRAQREVTVGMLINHTSGIDGDVFEDRGPDRERIVDAIERLGACSQIHDPGASFSYSNAGTVVAGYLCQVVRERSWYELIERQIFAPLELSHSIVNPLDCPLHATSVGHYIIDGRAQRTSHAFLPPSYAPAGATVMMAASDLLQFARAHLGDGLGANGARILRPESARLMRQQTAQYEGVGFFDAGLGWLMDGSGIINHGGGGPGLISWLYAHPGSGAAVAVLTNTVTGGGLIAELTSDFLANRGSKALGHEVMQLAAQVQDNAVDTTPYEGVFESVAFRVAIRGRDGRLEATASAKGRFYETLSTAPLTGQLRAIREHLFLAGPELSPSGVSGAVEFIHPDRRGRMQHLALGGRLLRRSA